MLFFIGSGFREWRPGFLRFRRRRGDLFVQRRIAARDHHATIERTDEESTIATICAAMLQRWIVVDARFAGSRVLVAAADAVEASVLTSRAPVWWNQKAVACGGRRSFPAQPEHPCVVARPGLAARFRLRREFSSMAGER